MGKWGPGQQLVDALTEYSLARRRFLEAIRCRRGSIREPLAEFAELLVAALTDEQLADNPVQKGWDLKAPDGTTTQVRYVANPRGKWVNGHQVTFIGSVDRYTLVMYEDLEPTGVLIFGRSSLAEVCRRLGKRHPNQETTLQITSENIRQIRTRSAEFAALGVQCFP